MDRKVLVILFSPRIPSAGGRRLWEVMGWNDPDDLSRRHIADLQECSHGQAVFQVVERIEVDRIPVKADGFVYDAESLLRLLRAGRGFHQPDAVDYHRILADFDILNRVASGAVDEVWLFAFPYAGFYESIMAGPGAFWCNAPPLGGTHRTGRRFAIMGYNYERGLGEMLENMGHRAESILGRVFSGRQGEADLWERFCRYDLTHPGRAEAGNVHFAPNSRRDYDWGNPARVLSRWHTWRKFPDLEGEPRLYDCHAWGGGDIRQHHLWWFSLFPHLPGSADGIGYNWWEYVVHLETVR